jgi:hypothetical protein
MSVRAFDHALAARRDADLASAMSELGAFLDLCRHAAVRQAFPAKALTWSASREPIALSVLLRGEPIWSAMSGEPGSRWLVSANGTATRMTKSDAMQHLAKTLAEQATMVDGIRFAWRKDDTIGGSF